MSVAILREELVEITANPIEALVLNQMMYWSERTTRLGSWFYKTAKELSQELFGLASEETVRRRLRNLVKNGLIAEDRRRGRNTDQTIWYRVCFDKIEALFPIPPSVDSNPPTADSNPPSVECYTENTTQQPSAVEYSAKKPTHPPAAAGSARVARASAASVELRSPSPRVSSGSALGYSEASPLPCSEAATAAKRHAPKLKASPSPQRKLPESIIRIQKFVVALAAEKGASFADEVKPPPTSEKQIEAIQTALGRFKEESKVEDYLRYCFNEGRDWVAMFDWSDLDLYLVLCNGAIKQWRLDTGQTKPRKRKQTERQRQITKDEYKKRDSDKGVGW